MSHIVRDHLRIENDKYDEAIRRFIPGYADMLTSAADAVAAADPRIARDLGAGTGALSEALLERHGTISVELLDVDPEMMRQARQRLQRFGDRARFTLRSYDEPLFSSDAIAASLSLHHIPTIEAKAALFARVFDALSSGGVFVNADVNMPTDPAGRERLYRYWVEHMLAHGIAADRAWQYFEEWSEEDSYLPLDAELAELATLGFDAGCVWKDGPVGVVVATKP